MSRHSSGLKQTTTAYVQLEEASCKACWKCRDACMFKVIGRIQLPWHKHVRFIHPDACTGCMKCVKACISHALQPLHSNRG